MCGIFGYIGNRKEAATIVFNGLKTLEYRGYDSWGIAEVALDNHTVKSNIIVGKHAGRIGNANVNDLPKSNFAFGHTRWATHGGVTDINAHPHLDCSGTLALVHNGIIENYEELKAKLIKLGHIFKSDTDSEIAIHLIEEYGKTMFIFEAVQKAFAEINGLNAFIVLNTKENNFIAVRNGSPLVVGFGSQENFLASDAAAMLPYTKQVHFLEDNQMAIVSADKIDFLNAITGKNIKPKKQTLAWNIAQAEKGNYPFFMFKEIYEQPDLIDSIALNGKVDTLKLARIIKKSYGTYLIGCGTAAYACMAGSYLFSKICHRHVNWAVASEFGYQLEFLTPKSLILALSQSGETMDILESVKKSKAKKASIFAIVNVFGSTLYREANYKLLIGAGPEISVASTKSLIGMLSYLTLLAYEMDNRIDEGIKILNKAAQSSRKVLAEKSVENIRKLVKIIQGREHIYVIGRGLSYPASLETALKIKEISYIHAEGLAAGELKHGPLALVEKGTPCIAYLPDDETYGANLSGAMEMKARGGYIIGVSGKPHGVFDYFIQVEDAIEATIIPNIIFAQLFAYELTVMRGLDPDKPRNLAKSVTVK
jgi:glutamine---fructose-6-phosphate transaminase (isomerizing)